MKAIKKALCLVLSIVMALSVFAITANAADEALYNIVICEDSKFTRNLAATALAAADTSALTSAGISIDSYCQYLNIKNQFPGVLIGGQTKEKADAAVAALKAAGYNNCVAANAKMGKNITWTMKDAKITITGTGDMYDFDDYSNRTPLYFVSDYEKDKNNNQVLKDNHPQSIMGNTTAFSIEVGEGITTIGEKAFRYVVIDDGIPTISNIGATITLPSTVKTIKKYAFAYSEAIKINVPDGVEYIGNGAFWGTNIESASIPKKAYFEYNPFAGTPVKSFTVDKENPYFCLYNGVVFSKNGKTLVAYPAGSEKDEYTVPNGVEVLGISAFSEAKVSRVILPESVTTIKSSCFSKSILSEIYITHNLKTIESYAFNTDTYNSLPYFTKVYYEKGTDLKAITVSASKNDYYKKAEKIELSSYPQNSSCMVSFECGESGIIPSFVMVSKGSCVSKPATPTADGNQFVNWYKDSAYSTVFNFSTPITENTTIYGKWKNSITTVSSISVDRLPDNYYFDKGDTFSSAGLKIKVTYSDGTTAVISEGFTCSSPDMSTSGQKTVTVSFGGKVTSYYIVISDSEHVDPIDPVVVTEIQLAASTSKFKNYADITINNKSGSADRISVNGKDYTFTDGKVTVSLGQLQADTNVEIKLYKNNNLVSIAKGTVTVPNGFFQKISSFFGYVFGGFKYKTTFISYDI